MLTNIKGVYTMKKAVPIISVILSLFLFASCGKEETEQQTPSSTPFQQQVQTPSPEPPLPEETPQEEKNSGNAVAPELKAFLDSYEEFVDQYIEFMQNYKNSSDTVAMLGDYMTMLQTLTEFETSLSEYDTDSMSDADALYYSEVCLRCSQKLLSAVG